MPSGQNAGKASAVQNTDTSLSTLHNMAFCRNTRHALHCQRSPPTLLPASQKKPAHRTVLVALDLTAAFDNVYHQQLLDCVFNTNLPATIRRWLYNYMQNRRAKVHFRQKEFKSRKVKTGVVQGGVLSPSLFNYYLADFLTPPPNIKLIKYADDITIYTSGPVVADLVNALNIYQSPMLNYISEKKLTV